MKNNIFLSTLTVEEKAFIGGKVDIYQKQNNEKKEKNSVQYILRVLFDITLLYLEMSQNELYLLYTYTGSILL